MYFLNALPATAKMSKQHNATGERVSKFLFSFVILAKIIFTYVASH